MAIHAKVSLLLLTVAIAFGQACHTTHDVPVNKMTRSFINNPVTVITKDGRLFEFVAYKITDRSVVGKDERGNEIYIEIEKVREVTERRGNKAVGFALAVPVVAFVLLYFWFNAAFSGLR